MTNTQNDNDFLYCCQEGKLKTLKHLVNNGYEPSKNVLHQALYFTLVGDHKNCYHYILDIIDFYNYDIDLYFNNNMIFNQALLNEKIGIPILRRNQFADNHKENFQVSFLNLLQQVKKPFYIEKLFNVLISTSYTTFLSKELRDTILNGKYENLELRRRILNTFRVQHIAKEF